MAFQRRFAVVTKQSPRLVINLDVKPLQGERVLQYEGEPDLSMVGVGRLNLFRELMYLGGNHHNHNGG